MKRILAGLFALAALGSYWSFSRQFGSFSAVRRYGREPGVADWAFSMPPGEGAWYLFGLLITLAAFLLFFLFHKTRWKENALPKRVLLPAAVVLAVLGALAIRQFALQGMPTCDDEMAYRFQAQILADGDWTAEPPPDAKAFEHLFLGIYRDRWFGQYSFGHPLVLALGEVVGLIGLIGPLLAGLMVLGVFLLTRRLFDETTALLAALLAAFSPMLLSTGATLLSQNSATTFLLFGVLFVLKASESGHWRDAFLAAALLGAAFWCRSQEPALLGLGPLLLLGWRILRGPSRLPLLGGALAGGALLLAPMLLLQWHLWGHPTWTNYQAYWWGYLGTELRSPFGFGLAPWDIVHTPMAGLTALLRNLVRLDAFLIGMPLSLLVAFFGFWTARKNIRALAVFAGFPLTCVVLFFYFWPGLADTGPLLYHAAGTLLLPFVAAGLLRLARNWQPPAAFAVVLFAAVFTFWPMQWGALQRIGKAGGEIPRLVAKAGIADGIVFTDLRPWRGGFDRCWVLGRPMPRPDLSDPVLYLKTQGKPVDLPLAKKLFPGRKTYFFKQIDGKAALVPLEIFDGRPSLHRASLPRDIEP